MNNGEFARLLNVPPTTVSYWRGKGWLVLLEDGSIDPEPSKARVIEMRGSLGRMSLSDRRKRSPWSHMPSCDTSRAAQSHEKRREDGSRG